MISSRSVYLFNQVTIIEEIQQLEIENGYFPTLDSTELRPGFGKIKNQYPLDKNLTFNPKMFQGNFREVILLQKFCYTLYIMF